MSSEIEFFTVPSHPALHAIRGVDPVLKVGGGGGGGDGGPIHIYTYIYMHNIYIYIYIYI